MSSPSKAPELSRDQQTLHAAVASQAIREFPRGIILRAELPHDGFEEFLTGNTKIGYVMLNFSDVVDVFNEYGTLDAILESWQTPIITATEADALLQDRTRKDIRGVLDRLQPAIYIPDTGAVYMEDSNAKQLGGIQEYKIRLSWLCREIEEHNWSIELLPLAKGMKQWHFEEYTDLFRRHGFTNFAFYTRQYCGGSIGNRITDLIDHINNFITVIDPDNVLAIARHGETHLQRLPQRVTGASGLTQFIENCSDDAGGFSEDLFVPWRSGREDALFANHDHTQAKLKDYKPC